MVFSTGLFAAGKALRDSYSELSEKGTTRDSTAQMLDFEEFNELVSVPKLLSICGPHSSSFNLCFFYSQSGLCINLGKYIDLLNSTLFQPFPPPFSWLKMYYVLKISEPWQGCCVCESSLVFPHYALKS